MNCALADGGVGGRASPPGICDPVDTEALFLSEADGYPNGYPCDADEMA